MKIKIHLRIHLACRSELRPDIDFSSFNFLELDLVGNSVVRVPSSHGGSREFESLPAHHLNNFEQLREAVQF